MPEWPRMCCTEKEREEMKIEPEPIIVFFADEIPELMTVLAIAADPYARGVLEIKKWANEKYEMLETFIEEYNK